MSTLYVLDWHRRNQGFYKFFGNNETVDVVGLEIGYPDLPEKWYKARDDSRPPPLTVHGGSGHCWMYCCMNPGDYGIVGLCEEVIF